MCILISLFNLGEDNVVPLIAYSSSSRIHKSELKRTTNTFTVSFVLEFSVCNRQRAIGVPWYQSIVFQFVASIGMKYDPNKRVVLKSKVCPCSGLNVRKSAGIGVHRKRPCSREHVVGG